MTIAPVTVTQAHDFPVRLVSCGPHGRTVTADTGSTVLGWGDDLPLWVTEITTGHLKSWMTARARDAAWSFDGRYVYLAGGPVFWALEAATGQESWKYALPSTFAFVVTSVATVAVAEYGELFLGTDDGFFEVWSPPGEQIFRSHRADSPVYMRTTPEPSMLLVSDGYKLALWSTDTRKPVHEVSLPQRCFGMSRVGANGVAAVRGYDRVQIVDATKLSLVNEIPILSGNPFVQMDHSGHTIVYGENDGATVVNSRGDRLAELALEGTRVNCAEFQTDGSIWTGSADGRVARWYVPASVHSV